MEFATSKQIAPRFASIHISIISAISDSSKTPGVINKEGAF